MRDFTDVFGFRHLPIAVSATYDSSDKGTAGHSPRYTRAIHGFEVEVEREAIDWPLLKRTWLCNTYVD